MEQSIYINFGCLKYLSNFDDFLKGVGSKNFRVGVFGLYVINSKFYKSEIKFA